jgi:hypothetical protein
MFLKMVQMLRKYDLGLLKANFLGRAPSIESLDALVFAHEVLTTFTGS